MKHNTYLDSGYPKKKIFTHIVNGASMILRLSLSVMHQKFIQSFGVFVVYFIVNLIMNVENLIKSREFAYPLAKV